MPAAHRRRKRWRRPRMLENGAPFSFADLVERVSPAVVTVTVEEQLRSRAGDQSRGAARAVPRFLQSVRPGRQQFQQPHKAVAMGSGFIIDRSGYIVTNNHVVDGRQEDHREAARRARIRCQTRRRRRGDRHRACSRSKRQAAADGRIRRRPSGARRRLGDRGRQSVRPLQHGDGRHHLVDRPRRRKWSVHGLSCRSTRPINRGNSGGPTFDLAGQGHRHELDDLFAVGRQRRHRLCHSVIDHPRSRGAAEGARPCGARLSGRQDPEPDAGNRGDRRLARRPRARSLPPSCRAVRRRRPDSSRAMSCSPSTANRSRIRAI